MASHVLADRYRLLEPIGHGGMGTVWRAEDELLHRHVAIKEVRVAPDLDPDKRDELIARTMREARICAGLSTHPGIVTIHDVVREGGRPWIVMELVSGRGLDRVVAEEGPLSPRRTAEVGRQIFAALDSAHRAGVVHRDVKPANVMLLPDGRAMLSDFGIAVSDSEDKLTLTGKLPGSPGYVAPERLRHNVMSPAADVWSLGATLYFAVEGRSAFERPTNAGRLTAALESPPDPPRRAGPLRPVLNGMLQPDPEHRLGGSALDSALAGVVAGAGAEDATPTQLDVSGSLPQTPAADRAPGLLDSAPLRPAVPMTAGSLAPARLDRRGWTRVLASLLLGLLTLIAAPLLVEYLSSVLINDDPAPSPSVENTAADHANALQDAPPLPEGFVEHTGDGFRVAAPGDWSAAQEPDGLRISAPDAAQDVLLTRVDLDGATPVEHLRALEAEHAGRPGFRSITLEEVDHPAGAAARWTFETAESGVPRMCSGLLVADSQGRAAMVVYSADPERWEQEAQTRQAALDSLRRA
ncbi:serine/threonine protein kinase [Streptomonospora sp. S1-112]|uniref:non-specific serine/threonine protein kinase n=1 Tax=Streptomonospora mangrovi TaxID=2883123 RepID=A0A9X3NPP6_9ACTN|nr:serine/threonine-protein kinase [Streptomonospora mangrovi]MDA0567607.1 serine/threonine protein kinase [Streptomonospora mangrovi]